MFLQKGACSGPIRLAAGATAVVKAELKEAEAAGGAGDVEESREEEDSQAGGAESGDDGVLVEVEKDAQPSGVLGCLLQSANLEIYLGHMTCVSPGVKLRGLQDLRERPAQGGVTIECTCAAKKPFTRSFTLKCVGCVGVVTCAVV
ncbi:hypothetical protein SKAU_G00257950 [Synaphobranchus kaupii]|uniref:Uncharacterized protein n=1 Tax=Synaphobranchus kaupii TaxID=118154 RepID=A0A9Q1F4H6_SYNKA|nr:hypothetical protein SKAU_G00257950 [Synaphobranchus kaupii]